MLITIIKKSIKKVFSLIKAFHYRKHKIDKNVIIGNGCIIASSVIIEDYTYINDYVRIDSRTKRVGKYCSISHNVKIGLGSHPSNFVSTSPVFYSVSRGFVEENGYDEYEADGDTVIGHDVWIGANAVVLAGITIGTGAIIGACSVVTKDVPPYAIVVGVPAMVKKYRFNGEVIELLLKSEWWKKDISILLKYQHLIKNPKEYVAALNRE